MPLSDVEIAAEIQAKRLVINPEPEKEQFGPSSVDLRLHPQLIIPPSRDKASGVVIDPTASQLRVMDFWASLGETRTISSGESYPLASGQFLIAKTLEYLEIPNHLSARIEGKSSLARWGLTVHMTAPTVQSGFEGRLILEMFNFGPIDLVLKPGMLIAQLILEHLGLPSGQGYRGRYAGQE